MRSPLGCPRGDPEAGLVRAVLGTLRQAVLRPSRYSPIRGPCLKPCPEPPPAIQAFSQCGWRPMRK